jgi:8-amino-7-oxononanoate synthase
MHVNDWNSLAQQTLEQLRHACQFRSRQLIEPLDPTHILLDGRRLINFASNDYLGLTHHPNVIRAASDATGRYGAGSGAAPLITGYTPAHQAAEVAIAHWKGAASAVVLSSGYQANHAAVQTFAAVATSTGRTVRFLLDKLSHASLVDAVRATGTDFRVFPHNHLAKLARLLRESPSDQLQVVVTESIFSMDGDAADLEGLARLKREHPFALLLDEAHSSGVYGENGSGLPHELGFADLPDVSIVTLSKAIGCAGGAVCGSTPFCEALVNLARPYIFSTALPPGVAAAAAAAIDVMTSEPRRQKRVRESARFVRSELAAQGFALPPGDSPIIPIVLGNETAALGAAAQMLEKGILCLAIRPPTVPRGASRLRVTISSEHSDDDLAALLTATRSLSGSGA